ncbi:hypothetical protein [Chroococcus sp. FPU101]|uniref:hypothetical protein n=1 Tax=Chroococcus sp. FPU101 TaxID=1974212 RepID=UPI001A8E4848|nr:hypothetical protein [Chroococcus sp. FPU101]
MRYPVVLVILTAVLMPIFHSFTSSPQMIASENKQSVHLTQTSKVSVNSIGPVKVGMTIEEASRAAGVKLIQRSSGGEPSCLYYKPQTGLSGVDFMVTDGRISRIDIANPKVTTLSGAKVGDSENQIKSLYAGQIQVEPHEYEPLGHYLIFVPQDLQDQSYRVLFETDGKKVTRWRVGKLPEVGWVEGCA